MNVTRHEKAAAVAASIQPNMFFNFFKRGHELVGVVLRDDLKREEFVTFDRKEVGLMARAYDLTLARGHCPYGSKSVDTLVAHKLDHNK